MFDEPLGALDRALRDRLLDELRGILHSSGIPAIYVTHDQEEAFAIADRIVLLHDGLIAQDGTPAEVSSHPASGWVAEFLGLGNVLEGKLLGRGRVQTSLGVLDVDCETEAGVGQDVALLIRPEQVNLVGNGSGLKGVVADVVFQKNGFRITLENGLYFFAPDAMEVGKEISFVVEAECLRA
jgi:ABC-type Fe3+/spermidine/putrescine transport system ATPase subunit